MEGGVTVGVSSDWIPHEDALGFSDSSSAETFKFSGSLTPVKFATEKQPTWGLPRASGICATAQRILMFA